MQKQQKNLIQILCATVLLNIIDIATTLHYAFIFGYELEGNPVMRFMMIDSPINAIMFKFGFVVLFVILIWKCSKQNYKFAYYAALFVAIVYFILGIWHLVGSTIYIT